MDYQLGPEWARERDARSPLARFRARFDLPDDRVYLDGNSLGPASRDAAEEVARAVADWRRLAIDGWMRAQPSWFEIGEELGRRQAVLVGAQPEEVVATGSTTGNLHALAATFYRPEGRRQTLLADELNFPSDLYALRAHAARHGGELRLVRSRDRRTIDEDDVIAELRDDVALVVLPSVLYGSGQLLDVERLASAARSRDIPFGLDCSHSVGCVPHRLHDWGVDFAVWCGYKYLNGGPGAIASLFVHREHFGRFPALPGWWGSEKARQFDMAIELSPAPNAGAWQVGTPPILSAVGLRGALRSFDEAGIERIRAQSLDLTGYLIFLVDELLGHHGYEVATPREPARRGGHVAIAHHDAVRIARALKARGIVPDYRPPDLIRLAPVALYNTFEELWRAAIALREIVEIREHERFPGDREVVA